MDALVAELHGSSGWCHCSSQGIATGRVLAPTQVAVLAAAAGEHPQRVFEVCHAHDAAVEDTQEGKSEPLVHQLLDGLVRGKFVAAASSLVLTIRAPGGCAEHVRSQRQAPAASPGCHCRPGIGYF